MTEQQKQFIVRKMNEQKCPYCGMAVKDMGIDLTTKNGACMVSYARTGCDKCAGFLGELFLATEQAMLNKILPVCGNPTSLDGD